MQGRMKDRIALVTGGGSGIGSAIARLFAAEGAKIAIMGRREDPLRDTVKEIRAQGFDASYFCGDVSVLEDVEKVINKVKKSYGTINALVNCAGVINSHQEDPTEMSEKEWAWLMDINIKGIFFTTKIIIKDLISSSQKGTIVNISSICAHQGCPGYATYSASKGAVSSYSKALASQFGSHAIRSNCISPGVVHTPLSYIEMSNFDERIDEFNKAHPLGRIGRPIDIAYAALFLSSDESSWITGQDIVVDGGWTLGD